MVASQWKGNRSLRGIVDSCLELAAESQKAVVTQRLDAAENSLLRPPQAPPPPVPKNSQSGGKEAKGKQTKSTRKRGKQNQIESVCSACVAVADELGLALDTVRRKTRGGTVYESDLVTSMESMCKTAVRGKYVLDGDAQSGSAVQWTLSGTELDLGYSHSDPEKKMQAERIWRYCDALLEETEEALTESLQTVDMQKYVKQGRVDLRSLLCSDLAHECTDSEVAAKPRVEDAAEVDTTKREPSHETSTPGERRQKKKKTRTKTNGLELEVITDEDVSTVREVSPGVFVENLEADKIASFLRGEPDELDVLVCRMEDLQRQSQREHRRLAHDGACVECAETIDAIDAEIEKLKDVPVATWSFGVGEEGERSAMSDRAVTYRALERGGSVPRCGESAAKEQSKGAH